MNLPFYAPLIAGPRIFNLPQLLLLFHLHLAGCPSGQRELTVNQPSSTSWVRIPHPPLKTARILTIRAVLFRCWRAFGVLPAATSPPVASPPLAHGFTVATRPRLHRRHPPAASPSPPARGFTVATRPRLHRRHPPAASPALPVAGLLGGVNFPLCDGKSPRKS